MDNQEQVWVTGVLGQEELSDKNGAKEGSPQPQSNAAGTKQEDTNTRTSLATKNPMYTEERNEAMSPASESGQSASSDHEPLEIEERRQPLSKAHVFLLNVTWFGLYVMFLDLSVVVVPAQIQTMVGSNVKGRWLGGMVAGGAVVMFVTGPLTGVLSDRLVSRHGRRRPIMFAGALVLLLGLAGMALSCVSVTAVQSPLLPTNGSSDECIVDLEERRCAPYRNRTSGVPMVHQGKPGDMAGLSSQEKQASGPVNVGNIGMFIIFYMILAASFTAITVSYNALIADKSHPLQRGINSGVMGAMILCGNICGASIGMFFMGDSGGGGQPPNALSPGNVVPQQIGVIGNYVLIAAILFICVVITVYSIREPPAKEIHEPLRILNMFSSFWEPLKENDFRWVFITRFFMQQGVSTVLGFLEYWLSDMVHLPHCWSPSRAVAMMLIPLLGTAAIGSVIGGFISDRTGRRKPLVIISSMIMFVVCAILAFIRGYQAYYIALTMTFVFGAGFGAFQAVDFALVMDVLPVEKDKAKDLAVWHQALILPQALATPIGGVLLDLFEAVNCHIGLGYIILYLVTALYFFLSGSFVLKIKGVS